MEKLASPAGICYYHFDALGSVTDLSNTQGKQAEHYTYSPFGKTKIYDPATGFTQPDSAYGNYYRFTARQWDPESSLYYYRARYYDAGLGRFLQCDPVGYSAGDLNLYRYCGNEPINSIDPYGTFEPVTIGIMIAGAMSFVDIGSYWLAEKIYNNAYDVDNTAHDVYAEKASLGLVELLIPTPFGKTIERIFYPETAYLLEAYEGLGIDQFIQKILDRLKKCASER